MLPLPVFDYHRPKTLGEAVELLARLGDKARIVAGGTDVLPNMKHGLFDPEHVVSIGRLEELRGIALVASERGDGAAGRERGEGERGDGRGRRESGGGGDGGALGRGAGRGDGGEPGEDGERSDGGRGGGETLLVGAGMRLAEIADSVIVRRAAPALAEACALVGGPHHRAMGTLGGNVCLDTRCRYYNQTYFWRKSLGFCIKKDGTVCHVVRGGSKCVAAASNDSAPALIALEATIHLLGPKGERRVPAADFYTADGVKNTVLEPGEIVVRVAVPVVSGRRSAFEKLRRRGAIDFPLLSVAARADWDGEDRSRLRGVDVVVSALGARPRRVRAAAKVAPGTPTSGLARSLAEAAFAECKPLTNLDEDAEWRREMIRVLVRKALDRVF